MKLYRVEFSPRSAGDLFAIADYIRGQGSVLNARRFAAKLRRAAESLRRMPARCPPAPEGVQSGRLVRHLVVGNYRILFTIGDDMVVRIEGVRHAARRPQA